MSFLSREELADLLAREKYRAPLSGVSYSSRVDCYLRAQRLLEIYDELKDGEKTLTKDSPSPKLLAHRIRRRYLLAHFKRKSNEENS